MDLESGRVERERALDGVKLEKEAAQREVEELRQELDRYRSGAADNESEVVKVHVKNYQIMKDAYGKMRAEHLELIRSVRLGASLCPDDAWLTLCVCVWFWCCSHFAESGSREADGHVQVAS